MKKFFALLLTLTLMLSLAVPAMAQSVDSNKNGSASITIENASKGETYKVVKLFDASVTGHEDGSIVYTGTIPTALTDYFETVNGYVQKKSAFDEAKAFADMKTWADGQDPTASAVSDGSALTFTNLPYGYYVITTTNGSAVTVNSTNPDVTVYDKNSKEPTITKIVNDNNVDIGQTITYTLTTKTVNYLGAGEDAEIVTQYVIKDTLPNFLSNVSVTKITIAGDEYKVGDDVPQFDSNKEISIPWSEKQNGEYVSKYVNGAEIVITYTAKVSNQAVIDGNGNQNIVTLTPFTTPDDNTPPDAWNKTWQDDEIIFTYAAALQKVDQNKKPLAGAKFCAMGLTVEKVSDGVYRVSTYEPIATEYGTEMETDAHGQLVILGLSSESKLTLKETEAPAGYNLLVETTTMTPVITGEEITATEKTIYYDANGNVTSEETDTHYTKTTYNVNLLKTAIVIVNQTGTELPETGGVGTTIFYVVGGMLLVGAVVLLITKKRMSAEG